MNNSDSILYFPSIEFRDPNWLKATLLIWGKVYRIVPKDYTPNDTDEIKRAVDAGLVCNLKLSEAELSKTYDSYNKFIEEQPFIPDGLDSYGKYERLHVDKIDRRLYPILEKVATEINNGFLNIPSELARGYMLYLATNAAQRRGINVATDNADAWVTSAYFGERGDFSEFVYGPSTEKDIHAYSNVCIRDLIPTNLSSASMRDVIEFSEKYKDEKQHLRDTVVDFLNELGGCLEADHAAHILDKYGKTLASAKNDFKASSGFLSKNNIRSSLVVGLPVTYTVLSAMGEMLGTDSNNYICASLFLGFVAAMAERNFSNDSYKNPVGNFLVNLDRNLAENSLQPNYSYLFDQFIND